MNIEKYKDKGLTGLANLGNTCYINSCMQILSHCYNLDHIIESKTEEHLNSINDSLLFSEWKNLKNMMWSKNCIIAPHRFIKCVQSVSSEKNLELFSGFAQNDLHEFLIFLIDCFHNSLTRKVSMSVVGNIHNDKDMLAKECYKMIKEMYSNTYSELLNLFYAIHVSVIKSLDNKTILSFRPEPFCLIDLPIINKKGCSLYDCFDLYTVSELLSDDNAWYNEKTNKKEDVYKQLLFWNLPEILIIDLKRFDNFNKKINTLVDIPIYNLDLTKYVIGYNNDSFKYNLFGICNHSGGCLGGHYTSFVKNANNKWYHFDDTSVTEIPESKLISTQSYCLFYQKIT
tara:strand:- start:904 stop:1929 length:1026 start_codon:yes stop_codon:yes gene_type:complete